jgi:hypothetical protein
MISDPVMDVATKIDTDGNSDDAMERGMKLLAERLGEMDWIDIEMEEASKNAIALQTDIKYEEESQNVEAKEETRIKYLEIYNDEIINNTNIQDSI